jgi:tRNA (guanine-N(7)-)-methyltransferase
MLKILKKIYFKFIKNNKNITVYLRGRLSDKQITIYKELASKYIINKKLLKNYKIKNNILEIGFGNGHHIISLGFKNTDVNIFGSELYKEGILNTLLKIDKYKLNNIKILNDDARDIIRFVDDNFFDQIFILFPDPWQKARHKKRRILQTNFIIQSLNKIRTGGQMIIATDWREYADMILENTQSLDQNFDKIIQKIEKYNKKNKVYIYHNNNYNTTPNKKDVEDILNSTFAKRAITEDRDINIFIIQK